MIKGTTSTGFEFEFDENRVEDYRVLSPAIKLAKKPDDQTAKFEFFCGLTAIIGDELTEKIVDHVVKIHGYAVNDVVAHEMGEIYGIAREALGEIRRKNSISSSASLQQTRMQQSVTSQKPTAYTIINPSQSEQPPRYVQDFDRGAE